VQQPPRITLLLLGVAIAASGLWFYLSHFYYDPGPYSIGVRNSTVDTTLRDVTLRLEPRGQDNVGIEVPGQTKWDMDPHWPVPTRVFVFFSDPTGEVHSFSATGAPPKFRGSICIVITKANDYAMHLELERRK